MFLAELSDGSALLLKWPHGSAELDSDNERFWLMQLASAPLTQIVRSAVPNIVAADEAGPLVVDALPQADTLAARLRADPDQPTDLWVHFAAVLASLHRLPVDGIARRHPDRRITLPLPTSWEITPEEFAAGYGFDFGHYVAAVQSSGPALDALRKRWRHETLIHFDLSADNVLVWENGSSRSRVRLIDWELAGIGDPMHDVGAVLSQLVTSALHSVRVGMSTAAPAPPDTAWELARRNAMRFVAAYREATRLTSADVVRAVRYAGLNQILCALGRLERFAALGHLGHLSLLIGQRMLSEPESLAVALVGRRTLE